MRWQNDTRAGQGSAPPVGGQTCCILFKFPAHAKGRRRHSVPAGLTHALGEKETDRGLTVGGNFPTVGSQQRQDLGDGLTWEVTCLPNRAWGWGLPMIGA